MLQAASPALQSGASPLCFAAAAWDARPSRSLNCPPPPPAQPCSGDDLAGFGGSPDGSNRTLTVLFRYASPLPLGMLDLRDRRTVHHHLPHNHVQVMISPASVAVQTVVTGRLRLKSALNDYCKLALMCSVLHYSIGIFINIDSDATYFSDYEGEARAK